MRLPSNDLRFKSPLPSPDPLDVARELKKFGLAFDKAKPYIKSKHLVTDTPNKDKSGHVPTHRLDQPTGRGQDIPWTEYEKSVLAKTDWSPDTAAKNNLSSLVPEVKDSILSMVKAALIDNIHLKPAETKRSQERQEMLFQKGRSTPGDVVTWTLTSNHANGRAVDFNGNKDTFAWLQKNAPTYGFNVLGPMDPGHVEMPNNTDPLEQLKLLRKLKSGLPSEPLKK